ncbi:MAG: hypothetical protein JRI45_06855 [Deltaproteobacteria bacterium]|nr:hypothetical protein [Deltaproteobacteria bacterium]
MRVEFLMRLREMGLLPDDKSKIFQDELLHERKAYHENSVIESNPNISPEVLFGNPEAGIDGLVSNVDEDEIHLKIHTRLRLSAKYDKFSPFQKKALNQLLQWHQERLQQAQQAAMEQQIQMMVQAEMAKAQGAALLEKAKTAGRIEVEKMKTKGDIVVEAVKQRGASAASESKRESAPTKGE